VVIPPLRDRPREIVSLAERLIAEACERAARVAPALPPEVRTRLLAHSWPGNVRELRTVVERAIVLSAGEALGMEHFVLDAPSAPEPLAKLDSERIELDRRRNELERERVVDALNRSAGNQTRAAELLGISRRTLLKRLDEYALPRPRRRE
jgi:two-component system response regulator AtoC